MGVRASGGSSRAWHEHRGVHARPLDSIDCQKRAKPDKAVRSSRTARCTVPAAAQQQGSVSVATGSTAVRLSTVTYKPIVTEGAQPFHHGSSKLEHPYDPKVIAQRFAA